MSRNRISVKLDGGIRAFMVHCLSGRLPLYIVNEFPKSGGSWVGQMLSQALALPFPRNQAPKFAPAIMHGHYLSPWGMRNVVVVWRDGRDVMVFFYRHCLFKFAEQERENEYLVEQVRGILPFDDYENVKENMSAFIGYAFSGQSYPRFTWRDFVRRWQGRKNFVHVRYEDMLNDTPGELRRTVEELVGRSLAMDEARNIAEDFSFANQAGRQPGQERKTSFMRKGIAGDWRNYFDRAAREAFDHYAGDELVLLGYEEDRSWVNATSRLLLIASLRGERVRLKWIQIDFILRNPVL